MFTRRCAERRFYIRPSKEVNNAYLYCLAVAAKEHSIDVCWASTLSNHKHDGGHDRDGEYPEFLRYFHSLLARCLDVHLGRWEHFWSAEQSGALHLADGETIFDRMVYGLTNAVRPTWSTKWPEILRPDHRQSARCSPTAPATQTPLGPGCSAHRCM